MIRSHVDLCFLIRVIDVPATMISPELRSRLKAVSYNKLSSATWSREALGPDSDNILNTELIFHECYHYWQGISYPSLIWYSFFAFMELINGFRELSDNKPLVSQVITAKGLDYLNKQYVCYQVDKKTVKLGESDSTSTNSVALNQLDLIESATSVAQWRMYAAGADRSFTSFSRWSKRKASYTKAFFWAEKLFSSKDLFLTAYPFLVAAAFCSTQPIRTFLSYVSRLAEIEHLLLIEYEPSQPFDWPQILDSFAELEDFDVVPDRMQELADISTPAYLPIALEEAVTFRWSGKLRHPISGIDIGRWSERAKAEPSFRLVLGYPDIVQTFTIECIESFQPPLTLYRYDLVERTLVVPTGDINRLGLYEFAGPSTGALLIDFMTMYSAGRRLSGAHFDDDFRLCGHSSCPQYSENLCNSWMFIPEDFRNCSFVDRIEYVKSIYLK